MIIYLSGAITGEKDYWQKFAQTEQMLTVKGYEVINPASICAMLPRLEHDEYMTVCFPLLALADAIYVIDGEETSKGVQDEIRYAEIFNKQILTAESLDKTESAERDNMREVKETLDEYFYGFKDGYNKRLDEESVLVDTFDKFIEEGRRNGAD